MLFMFLWLEFSSKSGLRNKINETLIVTTHPAFQLVFLWETENVTDISKSKQFIHLSISLKFVHFNVMYIGYESLCIYIKINFSFSLVLSVARSSLTISYCLSHELLAGPELNCALQLIE